ncbi:hypothetical protein [Methanolacinia paynteri]|nr:hypothetical protein [Methanolacinia paynteri]
MIKYAVEAAIIAIAYDFSPERPCNTFIPSAETRTKRSNIRIKKG